MIRFAQAWIALIFAREIQIPVRPLGHLELTLGTLHLQHMPRLHLMNPCKRGGAGHHRLHQLMEQSFRGETPLHRRMGKQHLELRTEHQSFGGHRPVLGLDPETIPHQIQTILFAIK